MTSDVPPGTLFVVGTPIGNMEDITLRALRVLSEVDVIAAEDTRVTTKLLSRHQISTPTLSFREQNARTAIPKIIGMLEEGKRVALVSDAGTPSVSDPGVDLVRAVREQGFDAVPIPGPSALAAAVSVAGMNGEGIRFVGFLPRKGKDRTARLEAIGHEPAYTVLYEAPGRLRKTLEDLASVCDERRVTVMREMTKLYEEVVEGTPQELAAHFSENVKGEVTIVVEGFSGGDEEITEERLLELIRAELGKGKSAKDISTHLASGLGLPRKKIYQLTLDVLKDA